MELSELERNLIDFIGQTNFYKFEVYAFRFAMAESDYLKIPITDTQSFRRLHRLRREFVLREVWDLAQLYQNEILQIEFEFPSVNEIADVVREKYG